MVEARLSSTFGSSSPATNTAADAGGIHTKKKKSSLGIFQDAITVNIPIGVTADLGVALRRSRTKRITALYAAYPSLKEKKDEEEEEEDDEEGGESDEMEGTGESGGDGGGDGTTETKKKAKKDKKSAKQPNNHEFAPQRHEFGSIMDYLEAKYTRGVMIHDEDDNKNPEDGGVDEANDDEAASKKKDKADDEDDEGQGSVYSESSFLDDKDLQRDVAEQVLAQTTTTKLELEGDDDFFVNVGDLDVEETELTQQHYDPLDDSPTKSKTTTKKRKKPSAAAGAKSVSPAKKKAALAKKKSEDLSKKKKDNEKKKVKPKAKTKKEKAKEEVKEDIDSDSSSAEAVATAAKKGTKKSAAQLKPLKDKANKFKTVMQKRFDKVKKMIKALTTEQLPRKRAQKSKVSITCPANKKEGDEVTFANPHIPGQRLRVQVPKGTFAGETFKVTVPVPKLATGDEDEGVDHNKFPRAIQDELDTYAREFDVYCKHEGEYRHARGEDYPIHLEKRKKYDQVVKSFPKNLMTPVDDEYVKKLVRRARQNKSKRSKSAAERRQSGDASAASPATSQQQVASEEENEEAGNTDEDEEQPVGGGTPHRTLDMPERGLAFPAVKFSMADFHQGGAGGQSQA